MPPRFVTAPAGRHPARAGRLALRKRVSFNDFNDQPMILDHLIVHDLEEELVQDSGLIDADGNKIMMFLESQQQGFMGFIDHDLRNASAEDADQDEQSEGAQSKDND